MWISVNDLGRSPARRRVLDGALRWALHWSDVRDQALHYFTLAWPLIRAAYLEIGRRLAANGVLPDAADVFYLTSDELRAWCQGPGEVDASRWARDVRDREAERERRRRLTPPDTVPPDVRIHLGPWDITALALFGQTEDKEADVGLRGSGVSAGRFRGRVRLLRSVGEALDLTMHDVLVVPHLTPAWSSVIARVGAVVTDIGGSLSHGSIVARELGVPAAMGTGSATKVLREGQFVDVDGGAGTVVPISEQTELLHGRP
jgi:phosphohistidine swiveling domain-containing protein